MRFLIILLIIFSFLSGANINHQIKSSNQKLNIIKKDKSKTTAKLSEVVNSIKKANRDKENFDKKINRLAKEKKQNKVLYKKSKVKLNKYNKLYRDTDREIKKRRLEFLSLLSNQFGVVFAMEQLDKNSQKSVIYREIYKYYKAQNIKEIEDLKSQISKWKNKKWEIVKKRKNIQHTMRSIENKKKEYREAKINKTKLLKKLAIDEAIYRKKLERIIDKQSSLRTTLANLNILHKKNVANARAEEQRRKRRIRSKNKNHKSDTKLSYYKDNVTKYRGRKTISPITNASVIKRFGTYTDPIYKIKIFNDSITLKAPRRDSIVKSVLDGKVVYSGKSSMLGNVVVVSHKNKIHTIYAGLANIIPSVKVGKYIKKGSSIGSVKSKLIFQATKNSKHINPVRLIKL